ncbi:MAG: hypothetical protein A3C90_01190 [Candidatus Magasanikbacteria bacterium RIFCSPHIGHO2_02_FULL_51_14]|uniref:Nucleotidyl transferase AbiEii/AbiGii toxin family protein n=1 Tax=Candidatus Magasanikbacteria bacterium RIFCSPHIGHO2_02_FULL_51_14 TaxID=1798683 RepID=A0A1F6MQQ8_9BACT|nr:MAG: hypothetical protein A3C90_01190 [Candidatus Magasanikbacteria bacterium RIFCSPHIGHO2_02_FULL_51_14]
MNQPDPRQLLLNIVRILDELHIPYLITGGMAVFLWGRPRFTADIDIIVELEKNQTDNLYNAVRALGAAGYLDRDAMSEAIKKGGEFNFIDGDTGMKVDFWLAKQTPFDRSRFERRIPLPILGTTVFFTSPEDLIIIKLLWYNESHSSRHLEDIESILAISEKRLDLRYIREQTKELGIHNLFKKITQTQ